ncbi:MAG: FadR/GntR family transcriptional regulator [Terriglobia bacterium]|jgi:DNA-binding FadR family transcriptional regulator
MPNERLAVQPGGLVRDTLTERTVQQLIGWLRDGTLKPGGKLPSQSELVQQLGISRTGVREALQVLAALTLIEIRPGLGCFVKTVTTEYIINADVLAILLEKEAILEVIEARKILEAGTMALATERAGEQDFWLMEDALNRIEKALQRGESVARIAPEFHIAVAEATHNPVLAKLVTSFNGLMAKAGQLVEATVEDMAAFKQHELESHRELYEVIRQGDPSKATQAMIDHIEVFQALIVKGFLQAEGVNS